MTTAVTWITVDTATDAEIPAPIAARWGFDGLRWQRLAGGLINHTFAIYRDHAPVAVLQQLHPVFGAEVNLDLEAVTAHLESRGMVTPRLMRTTDGAAWAEREGRVWRALTWVHGRSVAAVPDARWAEAGGVLVGRFHRAVADFSHEYRFTRANVHDTARHLARLRDWVRDCPSPASDGLSAEVMELAVDLGRRILDQAQQLPEIVRTPPRHCHGDLKIANLMFEPDDPIKGRCLVDLDTVGLATIAFELGDAMRSWCNTSGEDDAAASFDVALFSAAVRGFREVADCLLSEQERSSIVSGLQTVCIELAARFCIDIFEDRYFGWNPQRYPTRRQHNVARARSQLSLAASVRTHREEALAVVHR